MFDDFKEFLSALNASKVKYLVVGGWAVSRHAQPRATKDLDILIQPSLKNGAALFRALQLFGAPLTGLTATDFVEKGSFFRMGTPPVAIDILPEISGVEFDKAWRKLPQSWQQAARRISPTSMRSAGLGRLVPPLRRNRSGSRLASTTCSRSRDPAQAGGSRHAPPAIDVRVVRRAKSTVPAFRRRSGAFGGSSAPQYDRGRPSTCSAR